MIPGSVPVGAVPVGGSVTSPAVDNELIEAATASAAIDASALATGTLSELASASSTTNATVAAAVGTISETVSAADTIDTPSVVVTNQVEIIIDSLAQTTWTVPLDWDPNGTDASIEGIGGGASGRWGNGPGGTGIFAGFGGGAGAWAKLASANSFFHPGDVVAIQVGAGGAAATKLAKNGVSGTPSFVKDIGNVIRMKADSGLGPSVVITPQFEQTIGRGGLTSNCIGTYSNGGGNGGHFSNNVTGPFSAYFNGAGGGGAGGPLGPGFNAGHGYHNYSGGGGGGGTSGTGADGTKFVGGAGGAGRSGGAGGSGGTLALPNGTGGTNGGGGGGAYAVDYSSGGHYGTGGAGGNGTEWGLHGAGGGAGASSYNVTASPAGLWGGGGSGRSAYGFFSATDSGTSQPGAQGAIRIRYTPRLLVESASATDTIDVVFPTSVGSLSESVSASDTIDVTTVRATGTLVETTFAFDAISIPITYELREIALATDRIDATTTKPPPRVFTGSVQLIPLSPIPQILSIVIGGTEYGLVIQWCAPANCWMMDITDLDDNPIVSGIPLVTGADLLAQYAHLKFNVSLVVQTSNDADAVPTGTNLGLEGNLYIVSAGQ